MSLRKLARTTRRRWDGRKFARWPDKGTCGLPPFPPQQRGTGRGGGALVAFLCFAVRHGELRWTDAFGADNAPQAGDVLDLRWEGSAVARLSGAGSSASFVLNNLDNVEMRGDSNLGLDRIGRVLALNSGGLSLDGGGWAKIVSHGDTSQIDLSSGAELTMEADSSGALRRFALFSGRVDVSDDADGAPATLRCDDQEQRASGGGYFTECAGDISVQPPSAGQIRISYATPSRRVAETLLPSSSAAEAPLPVSGVEVALSGGDNEPIVLQVRGAAGAAATRLTVNPGLGDLRNVNLVIYPGPIVHAASAGGPGGDFTQRRKRRAGLRRRGCQQNNRRRADSLFGGGSMRGGRQSVQRRKRPMRGVESSHLRDPGAVVASATRATAPGETPGNLR